MALEKQILNKIPTLIKQNIPAVKIERIIHQPKIKGIIPDMVIEVDAAGKKRKLIIEVKSRGFPAQILQS